MKMHHGQPLAKCLAWVILLSAFCIPAFGQSWTQVAGGYPSVAGTWFEVESHQRIVIKQQGRSVVATHERQADYGTEFSWRMDGLLSQDGNLSGLLEYTSGLKSSASGYSQTIVLTLSPTGDEMKGTSALPASANESSARITWRRLSGPPSAVAMTPTPEPKATPTAPTQPVPTAAAAGRPNLAGTWYDYSAHTGNKGSRSTIEQNGDKLVFINEFNDRSAGRFLDDRTVIADAWQGGLKATLDNGNQRITFTNGSVWERTRRGAAASPVPGPAAKPLPTAAATGRPDLAGTWYDYSSHTGNKGSRSTIEQNGDKLVFINEFNDRSAGRFLDDRTVIADAWQGGLKATLDNGNQRITFTNGSVWERTRRGTAASPVPGPAAKPVPTAAAAGRPDLAGTWYDYSAHTGNKGSPSTIEQNGDKLVFINEFNDRSAGRFLDDRTVIADAWQGGLKATLDNGNQRITFTNGSVWERTRRGAAASPVPGPAAKPLPTAAATGRPDLAGTWYDYSSHTGNKGSRSTIEQNGDKLVFINEFNDRSAGRFLDDRTVIADAWQGGLKATLDNGNQRITFTNGSVWERSRRPNK